MQTIEKQIKLAELTSKENTAYNLNGVGLQVKEIADQMGVAYETAKCYMKSIKEKLGLQKDKEITAHFWCNLVGKDLDEVKKQVITSLLLLVFVFVMPENTKVERCMRSRLSNNRTVVCRRQEYTA